MRNFVEWFVSIETFVAKSLPLKQACFCFTLPFRFSKSFSLRFVMISVIILDSSSYYPRNYHNHRCHYTVPMLPHCRHEITHIALHSLAFSLRFVMISIIILDSSSYYPRIYHNHRCHYTVPMLPHCRHEIKHIALHSLGCETSLGACCDGFLNRSLRLLFARKENSSAEILISEKRLSHGRYKNDRREQLWNSVIDVDVRVRVGQ